MRIVHAQHLSGLRSDAIHYLNQLVATHPSATRDCENACSRPALSVAAHAVPAPANGRQCANKTLPNAAQLLIVRCLASGITFGKGEGASS